MRSWATSKSAARVAAQQEANDTRREQRRVHLLDAPIGLLVARVALERILLRVRGEHALDQRGLDGPSLPRDAEGRGEAVAHEGLVGAAAFLDLAGVEPPHVAVQRVAPVALHVVGLVLVDEDRHRVGRREQLEQRELGLRRAVGLGGDHTEQRPEHLHDHRRLAAALGAPDHQQRVVTQQLLDARLERRGEEPAEHRQHHVRRVHLQQVRQDDRCRGGLHRGIRRHLVVRSVVERRPGWYVDDLLVDRLAFRARAHHRASPSGGRLSFPGSRGWSCP